ncbi:MAG: P-type conjugative transfer protein TrbG [Sedimenticola sp.]
MKSSLITLLIAVTIQANAAGVEPRGKTGVTLATDWMEQSIPPKRDENGQVIFPFGATLPTIVCAPMRLCDIAFQAGEKIRHVRLGDTVRWKVSPAESGPDGAMITHAIIKPTESNLDTTLVVTTDRRTYHMRLVSSRRDWMPQVAFEYPEDQQKAWALQIAKQETKRKERQRKTLPSVGMSVDDLNFAYSIEGKSPWLPVRVFDDGSHTYIDLPREAKHRDAPILLVKSGDEERLVNYRMHGERFIVDSLFDEAELLSGVGTNQQKVIIRRSGG